MQWDKVKTILIVILLAVNAFLLTNLGVRAWQDERRTAEVTGYLRGMLAEDGVTLDDAFRLPGDKVLPQLSIDRSRVSEETVSAAMLGDGAVREEGVDGAVRFSGEQGEIDWAADGTVEAELTAAGETPEGVRAVRRRGKELFRQWGLYGEDARVDAEDGAAVLTAPVAGMPVHNRRLTLRWNEDGTLLLSGRWSFGAAYTTAREAGTTCAAADALLAFAKDTPAAGRVTAMTVGYRLDMDGGRRLLLVPTWKFQTDTGDYLVDCAKKTAIS